MVIRAERRSDRGPIHDVVKAAFAGMAYVDGDEAELVDTLRAAGALSVSLIAERRQEIIGQIAFSPARASDGAAGWYALGPVSVLPSHQRKGIGAELVRAGLTAIDGLGAVGCILTGDPDYYARFGFVRSPLNAPDEAPAAFFMIKLLKGSLPVGSIHFHA